MMSHVNDDPSFLFGQSIGLSYRVNVRLHCTPENRLEAIVGLRPLDEANSGEERRLILEFLGPPRVD